MQRALIQMNHLKFPQCFLKLYNTLLPLKVFFLLMEKMDAVLGNTISLTLEIIQYWKINQNCWQKINSIFKRNVINFISCVKNNAIDAAA